MKRAPSMYQGGAVGDLMTCGVVRPQFDAMSKIWGYPAVRVLVAGDRGYIGAVMVPFLRAAGHHVDGLDVGLYEGCDLGPGPDDVGARPPRDIRDAQPGELAGYDAVICLAALSNDP